MMNFNGSGIFLKRAEGEKEPVKSILIFSHMKKNFK